MKLIIIIVKLISNVAILFADILTGASLILHNLYPEDLHLPVFDVLRQVHRLAMLLLIMIL